MKTKIGERELGMANDSESDPTPLRSELKIPLRIRRKNNPPPTINSDSATGRRWSRMPKNPTNNPTFDGLSEVRPRLRL